MLLHPLPVTESSPWIFFFSEILLNRLSRHVSCAFWIFKIFAISGSDTIFTTTTTSLWARKQQITHLSWLKKVRGSDTTRRQLSAQATSHSVQLLALSLLPVQAGSNPRGQLGTEWALLSERFVVILLHKEIELPEHRSFGSPGAQPAGALLAAIKALLKATHFYRTIPFQ